MPKTTAIQTNFTAGEISPRLLGRVDIDKYRNAAEGMVNCHPLVHGGCVRRAGKRMVGEVKDSDKIAILIKFVFSRTAAYQLEFGDLYMRVFTKDKAQVLSAPFTPYEIVTPFTEAELDDIHFVQGSSTMFLAHIAHPIQQLTRSSDTNWKLVPAPWEQEPSDELIETPNATLTLSATTGAITATASAASFINADVGRQIVSGNGVATVTGFVSNVVLNCTVVDAFASVGPIAALAWGLNQSPKTQITASAVGPLGAAVTVTAIANTWKNLAGMNYVGKFVRVNGGLIELTSHTSVTVINGVVRSILSSALAVGADGWTLDTKIWDVIRGYPNAVGLYQQRLVAGGSPGYPQTVWGTKVAEYFNFSSGANDADGFSFTINSDQVNPIQHLTNTKALAVFTYGGEVTMKGGAEKALATTNVQSETQSAFGCNTVRPLRVGNEILFWTRSGRKLRAFAYAVENDSFRSPDMTILAEHISSPGVISMAYAQEPDSVIHAVRADGIVAKCTFDRDQNVIGWARDITRGVIEWVSDNPAGSEDQTWNVTARLMNGGITRFVEVDDPDLNTDCAVTGSTYRPCTSITEISFGTLEFGLVGHGFVPGDQVRLRNFEPPGDPQPLEGVYSVLSVTDADHFRISIAVTLPLDLVLGEIGYLVLAWAGYDYAENQELLVIADGVPKGMHTVVGGTIQLTSPCYEIEAGFPFENYVDVLPIEQPGQFGTAQGNAISVSRYVVRCYQTIGMTINGTQIPTRQFGSEVLDHNVVPFTGDIDLSSIGWDQNIGGRVRIGQSLPFKWQILALIREVTVNN